MAIILGGVTLPDTLSLADPFGNPLIVSNADVTIGGNLIIIEQSVSGRPITIVGDADVGWIEFSVLQALKDLAKVPGASYTLTFESDVFTVRFRHEDQPVISAEPIVARPNHAATDLFNNVVINLMEL